MDILVLTVVVAIMVYVGKFKDDFKKEDTELMMPFLIVIASLTLVIKALIS